MHLDQARLTFPLSIILLCKKASEAPDNQLAVGHFGSCARGLCLCCQFATPTEMLSNSDCYVKTSGSGPLVSVFYSRIRPLKYITRLGPDSSLGKLFHNIWQFRRNMDLLRTEHNIWNRHGCTRSKTRKLRELKRTLFLNR